MQHPSCDARRAAAGAGRARVDHGDGHAAELGGRVPVEGIGDGEPAHAAADNCNAARFRATAERMMAVVVTCHGVIVVV